MRRLFEGGVHIILLVINWQLAGFISQHVIIMSLEYTADIEVDVGSGVYSRAAFRAALNRVVR